MSNALAITLLVLFILSLAGMILGSDPYGDNDIDRDARDAKRNAKGEV